MKRRSCKKAVPQALSTGSANSSIMPSRSREVFPRDWDTCEGARSTRAAPVGTGSSSASSPGKRTHTILKPKRNLGPGLVPALPPVRDVREDRDRVGLALREQSAARGAGRHRRQVHAAREHQVRRRRSDRSSHRKAAAKRVDRRAPVWKSKFYGAFAESSRRPPRHRRDALSMAWRCGSLTARRSQHGRAIAEK